MRARHSIARAGLRARARRSSAEVRRGHVLERLVAQDGLHADGGSRLVPQRHLRFGERELHDHTLTVQFDGPDPTHLHAAHPHRRSLGEAGRLWQHHAVLATEHADDAVDVEFFDGLKVGREFYYSPARREVAVDFAVAIAEVDVNGFVF